MNKEKLKRNMAIMKKHEAGWSYRKIAKHFNVSHVVVFAIVKRLKTK